MWFVVTSIQYIQCKESISVMSCVLVLCQGLAYFVFCLIVFILVYLLIYFNWTIFSVFSITEILSQVSIVMATCCYVGVSYFHLPEFFVSSSPVVLCCHHLLLLVF